MGWRSAAGFSTLIECKASRADMKTDFNKLYRRFPKRGLGRHRYIMAPRGLLTTKDIHEGWGLLEVTAKRVFVVQKSTLFLARNQRGELSLLLSACRRLGNASVTGVSVKPYRYSTKNTATIGTRMGEDDPLLTETASVMSLVIEELESHGKKLRSSSEPILDRCREFLDNLEGGNTGGR